MIRGHPLLRGLAAVAIWCGIVIWAGLALFGLAMVTQGEGSYSPVASCSYSSWAFLLALGCGAMVASWRVLGRPPTRRRLPLAVLIVVGAQLGGSPACLQSLPLRALRRGLGRLDLTPASSATRLVELFAYYPLIGAAAIAAAVVVIALMLACLLRRSDV